MSRDSRQNKFRANNHNVPNKDDDYIYFVVKKDLACISRDSRDTNKQN